MTPFASRFEGLNRANIRSRPGFIAGVTNPMFERRHEWWDVLCNIDTGRVKISPDLKPPPQNEGLSYFGLTPNMTAAEYLKFDTMDSAFMADILTGITSR